ncbi:hypothetical protein TSOC_003478 [Tetrabaena socialis]|uniref:Uncharacterized protein n=1 Tax=Tetrabaena socialis TaxID=47790 RepID=A0A2J8ABG7_9CHLO|nr:hypothetical protein TSOC_003478 [Tetrabaena socialis]|eukprot:PNH09875.1 hypothetical protein TSOC_003478 [Tetrabaena socialis]
MPPATTEPETASSQPAAKPHPSRARGSKPTSSLPPATAEPGATSSQPAPKPRTGRARGSQSATSTPPAAVSRPKAASRAPAPLAPPPLSEQRILMAPDAIPPLLDWVTNAAARPVAVQCILDRFYSADALQCVRAAEELAASAGGVQQAGTRTLVFPSHLALAALSSPHPDSAAALGVLRRAGLTLQRAEAARAGARGTSTQPDDGCFSPATQHFLFQSYRWAVYTGRSSVLPCHLLWALSADPRVAYSQDRRDPLDPADWRPPLVGLMQAAVGLKQPAQRYRQLLGMLQRAIDAAPVEVPAAGAAASSPPARPAAERAPAAAVTSPTDPSGGPAVSGAPQLHRDLDKYLSELLKPTSDHAITSTWLLDQLIAAVLACRAAGLVLSRAQLEAIDRRIQSCLRRPAWALGCEAVLGTAALGYTSPSLR